MSEARYAVGIDLGTTHCALAEVDLEKSEGERTVQRVLSIPQVDEPGSVKPRPLLPSFMYLPKPGEFAAGALNLPWAAADLGGAEQAGPEQAVVEAAIGEVARRLGLKTPSRVVSSAKSWLCHPGVDRRSALLPLHAPDEVATRSPLAASTAYLGHLKRAFEHAHQGHALAEQAVVITVPASFDPVARELTAEAAQAAGLPDAVLLEEPQAALYAWVQQSEGRWRDQVSVGDVILVVDVGGGTTDLSLIAVEKEDGRLALRRVAVGEHILLGGDNMDLALAVSVQKKLAQGGKKLDAWQLSALAHGCRAGKERLLTDPELETFPLVVPSRGSRLLGGSIRTELTRREVEDVLLEGFFPLVSADARPAARPRGALTQLGLPYAQDAAITRHLAAFLARQSGSTAGLGAVPTGAVPTGAVPTGAVPTGAGPSAVRPTAVLFNGGVFHAEPLRQRVVEVLNRWLSAAGAPAVRVLPGADHDRAVANGAAYYAYARRGRGVRIRGGTAMAYYVGVEAAMPAVPGMEPPLSALCVAPFGIEEGSACAPAPAELGLVVGEPVSFRFFGSTVRRDDEVGRLLDAWEDDELTELPPIEVTLPADGRTPGEVVPVRLQAAVTEVGTLALSALPRDGEERWKVEFDVRHAGS